MPLSEREQKLLEQLEQQLSADDPRFASSMSETGRTGLSTRNLIIGAVAAVVGLGVLLWGVSSQLIWLGLIGLAVMAAGIYVATSRSRGRADGSPSTSRPQQPAGAGNGRRSSGFMDDLEQRWEQRRQQDP